jgi:hypothetical protein
VFDVVLSNFKVEKASKLISVDENVSALNLLASASCGRIDDPEPCEPVDCSLRFLTFRVIDIAGRI